MKKQVQRGQPNTSFANHERKHRYLAKYPAKYPAILAGYGRMGTAPGPKTSRTFIRTFYPAGPTREIATSIAKWYRDTRSAWWQKPKSRHKSRQTVGIQEAKTSVPFRSMRLNESIVEDAAVTWFGELGYAFGHGPQLAPTEPPTAR